MSTNTRTATFVKQINGTGNAAVYRCDPPMPLHTYPWEIDDYAKADEHDERECPGTGTCTSTEYVWVSAANVMFSGPETYIFPCDADGEVTDWGELPGSYKGGLDHEEALAEAGYEIMKENER